MRPEVSVTWLGHASIVLDLAGTRVLTDPLLRRHAGLLRRRGAAPAAETWSHADAVLISHLHHDHAELGSLHLLDEVPVLSAAANAHWMHGRGVSGAVGLDENHWWTVPGGNVRVRRVPAVHNHRPMPHRPNAATGYILQTEGFTVWFAGDTGPFPQMAHLADMAEAPIDLALVPVGGWGPRLSGGHLDPVQAAHAVAVSGARRAVPVHWGTLHAPVSRGLPPGWMDRAGPAFAASCARIAPDCEVTVLTPGERLTISSFSSPL
ncbi:MAG: MBL fold metallo-hydrolase [Micrococcales bacterium]|nr:MBL fold metallo-hydrolase [Micrococcales bacterium]